MNSVLILNNNISSLLFTLILFIFFFILLWTMVWSIVNSLSKLLSLKLNRIHCLLFYNIIFHLINLIRLRTLISCCSSEFLVFQLAFLALRSYNDLWSLVWYNILMLWLGSQRLVNIIWLNLIWYIAEYLACLRTRTRSHIANSCWSITHIAQSIILNLVYWSDVA